MALMLQSMRPCPFSSLARAIPCYTFASANPRLYSITGVYHDVTTGNDGYFSAGTGWDYPTGLGHA